MTQSLFRLAIAALAAWSLCLAPASPGSFSPTPAAAQDTQPAGDTSDNDDKTDAAKDEAKADEKSAPTPGDDQTDTPESDAAGKSDGKDKTDAKTEPEAKTEPGDDNQAAVTPAPAGDNGQPAPGPAYQVEPVADAQPSRIGALEPRQAKLQVDFSSYGASIDNVQTARFFETVEREDHYTIIRSPRVPDPRDATKTIPWDRPFSARSIQIDDAAPVDLRSVPWQLIESDGAAAYRIVINDADGQPVLQITRTYTLGEEDHAYVINCRTEIKNLTGRELTVRWRQNAIGDVHRDEDAVPDADTRQFIVGYFNLDHDPNKTHVYTEDASIARSDLTEPFAEAQEARQRGEAATGEAETRLKRFDTLLREDLPTPNELVWFGTFNRYFTAAMYRPDLQTLDEREVAKPLDELFIPVFELELADAPSPPAGWHVLMFSLRSQPRKLGPAGGENDAWAFDLSLYAGPRDKTMFDVAPYDTLEFDKLVTYDRTCTFCFFQWLADFLLWFLTLFHALFSDWALAIIALVCVVRLLLHPITKRAQVNMMKMSKSMAKLQPEMAKIKEKFKDDQQRQHQEMMALYREKGVSPFGFLGCLPMFLQTPIWIALWAMLWGAIELRHQAAFYGIFQMFGDWQFLNDLSTSDNFIRFAEGGFSVCGFQVPYALNILPILMAVMFYLQQKFTTPPPADEKQAEQQKMMKWVTLMFPIFLYGAPSGLTLYIMASSTIGMVEGYYVRKHIKEQEESGELFKKKPRKPGGFMDRIQKAVEAKQQELAQREQNLKGGGSKGGGGKRPGGKKRKRKK